MGEHQKEAGIKALEFLEQLGLVLGYYTRREEYMFRGIQNSPILDLTWRKAEQQAFPLFIFEVESTPEKSASDNAVKVFSRKTESFAKPLFFFHVFVEQKSDTKRVESLRDFFDKVNYGTYLLSEPSDGYRLLSEVIEQHLRIEPRVDIPELLKLLEKSDTLNIPSVRALEKLIECRYDLSDGANFIMSLEHLILENGYPSLASFYLSYLPKFLSYRPPPQQDYQYLGSYAYSGIIHHSLLLIMGARKDFDNAFNQILEITQSWDLWSDWQLNLTLSNDHDDVALTEYPMYLSMLALAFRGTQHAKHFSHRLRLVIEEAQGKRGVYFHGLIWLLLASRISQDEPSYEYARAILNDRAKGIPTNLVLQPSLHHREPQERFHDDMEKALIPSFADWGSWLQKYFNNASPTNDYLQVFISGFLVLGNGWDKSRFDFSQICLLASGEEK